MSTPVAPCRLFPEHSADIVAVPWRPGGYCQLRREDKLVLLEETQVKMTKRMLSRRGTTRPAAGSAEFARAISLMKKLMNKSREH